MSKKLYLSVTGTMGSGKTTAARILTKQFKFRLLEENLGENAFLARFYSDMKRWAFHSQTFYLMEKITQLLETAVFLEQKGSQSGAYNGIIQDTPIYQDVFSYAKAQHIIGNMDDAEWRLYRKIFNSFETHLPKPGIIIYLKTSLEKVKERISSRDRKFELKVPEGYLELLEMLNESWMKKEADGIKIITVDTDNLDIVHSPSDKKKFLETIEQDIYNMSLRGSASWRRRSNPDWI